MQNPQFLHIFSILKVLKLINKSIQLQEKRKHQNIEIFPVYVAALFVRSQVREIENSHYVTILDYIQTNIKTSKARNAQRSRVSAETLAGLHSQ